jgi:hypothetical protein
MGEPPFTGASLDRIDNNGSYSKENCRWVSMKEQARNRRNNTKFIYNGKEMCLVELAEISGIHRVTLQDRIKSGLTPEQAINYVRKSRVNPNSLASIAKANNISYDILKNRVRKGMTVEEALAKR